ncbi:MAG: rRNA adenine N-6-methyltransferase family protein, partial [Gammaproteobacteria bacterium]
MATQLRKRFGQHLLTNPNTISNIVKVINPKKHDHLVEIGPGRGAITIPVLKKVGTLHAIELDRDIAKEVTENCKNIGELIIHQGDALNFDFNTVARIDNPIR